MTRLFRGHHAAALVTVTMMMLFVAAIVYQARVKFALKFEAAKKKERFLRYANTDARMVSCDSALGPQKTHDVSGSHT